MTPVERETFSSSMAQGICAINWSPVYLRCKIHDNWPTDELALPPAFPSTMHVCQRKVNALTAVRPRTRPSSPLSSFQILHLPADHKAITSTVVGDLSHLNVQAMPEDEIESLHYVSLVSRQLNFNPRSGGNATVRHLSWSPPGCSATGGCLLTTLTNDHRV